LAEKEFNLLHEPWILVMKHDGQTEEVSLLDVFRQAHLWRGLAGELRTQDVAILRLLLAVLHAVFARYDVSGDFKPVQSPREALDRWQSLWHRGDFPVELVRKYLMVFLDRFWLFHPTQPFYQVATIKEATEYTGAKLNGELSESSNKLRLFPKRTGAAKSQLSYAEAARWLIYVNAYDDTSAKPRSKGLPSPGAGWLGKLGLITAVGDNLLQTLVLNLVLLRDGTDDLWGAEKPLWESDVRSQERVQIEMPDNLSELLTLQSRRLLLQREGEKVIGFALLGGDFFEKTNAFSEQMTVWRAPRKGKDVSLGHTPRRHDVSRQLWRDFAVLIAQREGGRRPGVVNWLARLKREELLAKKHTLFEVAAVNYGDKDFFVDDVFSDSLAINSELLSGLGSNWVERIADEIEVTERLVQQVGELAQRLATASGDLNSAASRNEAKEQAYFRLDRPFRHWLEELNPSNDDIDQQCEKWWSNAQRIVRNLGRELTQKVGPQAFSGRMVKEGDSARQCTAPEAFNRFLFAINSKEALKGGSRHDRKG